MVGSTTERPGFGALCESVSYSFRDQDEDLNGFISMSFFGGQRACIGVSNQYLQYLSKLTAPLCSWRFAYVAIELPILGH